MKIEGNKKTAIMVLGSFVLVITIVLVIAIVQTISKKYPEEPLPLKNLGSSEKNLNIDTLKEEIKTEDIPVYFVQPKLHIELVEKMIDEMGLSLKRKDIVKDAYIEWSDDENTFVYDAMLDTVSFQLSRRISLERGEESFKNIFKKYLSIDYTFKLVREKKELDGGTAYYGTRMIDDLPMEFGTAYEYSDILKFDKGGYLSSGQLLLVEVQKYELHLPIITKSELSKYINTKVYPKEHYVDTSVLGELLDFDYLDDDWSKIEETLSDCNAQSSDLMLLFSNSNQGYLLPVFKISATCKVTYESNEYSVPALFYLNAADPAYVTR